MAPRVGKAKETVTAAIDAGSLEKLRGIMRREGFVEVDNQKGIPDWLNFLGRGPSVKIVRFERERLNGSQ